MSALRVSRPGQPTELIDLGPAVGRTLHTRGAITGGMLVVAQGIKRVPTEAEVAAARARGRRYYENHREEVRIAQNERREQMKPRCGRWMPIIRESCGRRPGHKDSCRSAVVMADEARRRWSGGTHGQAR